MPLMPLSKFFRRFGSSGKKPASPTPLAPKVGTSSSQGDIENKLREVRAKWDQFTEETRRAVNEEWQKARQGIAETSPRFTMPPPEPRLESVEEAQWYPLVSSNVDRIRYGEGDSRLQVIFHDGSLYQYEGVEPEVFMEFLRTHSPGQFTWNVLRQFQYPYQKLSSGHATRTPAAPRFDEMPYAVPDEIQAIQAKAGRKPAQGTDYFNLGTPVAQGFAPPPPAFSRANTRKG